MMSLQENRTDNLPNTNPAQNVSSSNPPSIKTENPPSIKTENPPVSDIHTAVTQPSPHQLGNLSNVLTKKRKKHSIFSADRMIQMHNII